MDEEAALLRAVCEQPGEDTVRLVYADWLDEHAGDSHPGRAARAEFIRLQCALAAGRDLAGRPLTPGSRRGMGARERELLECHRSEWARPLRDLGASYIYFQRGWPEWVTMFATASFTRHAERLFQLAPVRQLTVRSQHPLTAQELTGLASSRHLTNLTTLNLVANGIGDEGAHALAASPHLSNLTKLNLSENCISDEGAHALASSPHLANLTTLVLHYNPAVGPAVRREIERTLEARRRPQGGGRRA